MQGVFQKQSRFSNGCFDASKGYGLI